MKNRDIYWRRYKIQETLYIGQWCLSPLQSRHFGTSHSFPQSPSAAPSYFPESHWQPEISSLSKVILVFGKAVSCRAPNLGYEGVESPEWFDISPKDSARDTMHKQAHCRDGAANCQLPRAVAFWIIWIVSMEECSNSTKSDTDSLLYPVILNVMATQYTCSCNSVHHPHWLGQWGRPCSHMCIPVHPPWLPGYIDVMQTIFIVLTMAGLFPDRPSISPVWKPCIIRNSLKTTLSRKPYDDFHFTFYFVSC